MRWRPSRTKSVSPARVSRTGGGSRPSSSHARYRSILARSRPRSRRRMSASGTQVDVNDAYAARLLPRGRLECGRVESNHHSHGRRGYSALSSPVLGVRRVKRGGRSDSNRHSGAHDPGCLPLHHGRQEKWKAGSAPRNRRQRRCRFARPRSQLFTSSAPLPARSAPPPPHRSALEACRSQLHVRAHALRSPCSVTSSARPSTGRSSNSHSAGGIRTHGLELMRLARTAAPLPRVALSRERRSGRQDSNLRSPTPEVGGVADLPYDQSVLAPRQDSNLRHEG